MIAQFIILYSASTLAEKLCISSLFSSQSYAKRRGSLMPPRSHVHQLRPSTNCDNLSGAFCTSRSLLEGGGASCSVHGQYSTNTRAQKPCGRCSDHGNLGRIGNNSDDALPGSLLNLFDCTHHRPDRLVLDAQTGQSIAHLPACVRPQGVRLAPPGEERSRALP